MRDAIAAYVKKVKEVAEYCKGNEQATKKSLIEPLFVCLGYDVADPRECVPEHKEDFGKYKGTKPVDYAFFKDGAPIFFVEAKHVDKRLAGYDEQLGAYFAKAPLAKLGILTNGVHWRFYTDLENENVMDKKPFVEWLVLGEEPPPYDFLTLLQKSQYNAELMRTFAERRHQQNLLVDELSRLLEPAPEFIRVAIRNIETRYLTPNVVDSWKPVLKAAIAEWAKQQRLSSVLGEAPCEPGSEPQSRKPRPIETTQAELDGFATVQRLLGPDRPVEYEDTAAYFKIHLPGKPFWAICRLLNFGEKRPSVRVRLPADQVKTFVHRLTLRRGARIGLALRWRRASKSRTLVPRSALRGMRCRQPMVRAMRMMIVRTDEVPCKCSDPPAGIVLTRNLRCQPRRITQYACLFSVHEFAPVGTAIFRRVHARRSCRRNQRRGTRTCCVVPSQGVTCGFAE